MESATVLVCPGEIFRWIHPKAEISNLPPAFQSSNVNISCALDSGHFSLPTARAAELPITGMSYQGIIEFTGISDDIDYRRGNHSCRH
jgi:hypothetical protein